MKDARTLELEMEVKRLMAMFKRRDDRKFLQEPELPTGFDTLPFPDTEPQVRIEEQK
jgi:hypothetical protein